VVAFSGCDGELGLIQLGDGHRGFACSGRCRIAQGAAPDSGSAAEEAAWRADEAEAKLAPPRPSFGHRGADRKLKLQIAKLKREQYGPSVERSRRLLERFELQFQELESSASEEEVAVELLARSSRRTSSGASRNMMTGGFACRTSRLSGLCAAWLSKESCGCSAGPTVAANQPPSCTCRSAPPSSTTSIRKLDCTVVLDGIAEHPVSGLDELLPWSWTKPAPALAA
jgi:hypothetical protein